MTSQIGKKKNSSGFAPFRDRSLTGFTFIEIIFVTIILSILISIAIPNFSNTYNSLQLNNAAWDVYTILDYARDRSMIEQKVFKINIDKISNRVSLLVKEDEGDFIDIKENLVRSRHLPMGISIECIKDEIIFFPNGENSGKDIVLKNQLEKTVTLKRNIYGYKIAE